MKRAFRIFNVTCFNLCLLTIILLSSCEMYHFAYPLPVDAKNIYKIPRKLRGSALYDEKKGGFLLEKESITMYEEDSAKIINGVWISPRDTTRALKSDTAVWRKIEEMKTYNSRYTIKFDSLKNPVDTIEHFLIRGNRMYGLEDNRLIYGVPFSVKGDTLYVASKWRLIELGPGAFLRKVSRDFYLLNVRDYLIGDDHYNWWQVILIEKRKDGKVVLRYWDSTIEDSPTRIYRGDGGDYYFDSQWTRKDILKLIEDGAFESLNEAKED